MIVISSALVLAQQSGEVDGDLPAIGYRSIVHADSVTSTYHLPSYPASNIANPATHLEWRSSTIGDQSVGFPNIDNEEVDYVAIAKHNLGSAEIAVYIVGIQDGDQVWLTDPVMLSDDSPAMFRFEPGVYSEIYIIMLSGAAPPRIAVAYVGKLLDLERKIYVGHTPMVDAVEQEVANGRSESGNFLGRIVLGERTESPVPLSLISPAWFREHMRPFLASARERPFFFAWRPASYPFETGYAWFSSVPKPAPAGPSNLIAMDWQLSGIV